HRHLFGGSEVHPSIAAEYPLARLASTRLAGPDLVEPAPGARARMAGQDLVTTTPAARPATLGQGLGAPAPAAQAAGDTGKAGHRATRMTTRRVKGIMCNMITLVTARAGTGTAPGAEAATDMGQRGVTTAVLQVDSR